MGKVGKNGITGMGRSGRGGGRRSVLETRRRRGQRRKEGRKRRVGKGMEMEKII